MPREVGPVVFDDGLTTISSPAGGRLTLAEQARRSRENRTAGGLVRSVYAQPFGTFSGGVETIGLTLGWGVCERHRARW